MEKGNTSSDHKDPSERAMASSSSRSELPLDGLLSDNGGSSTQTGASVEEDRKGGCFSEASEHKAFPAVGSAAARYRLMSPARLPISRSPCLTIPPGLSPTSLLDSPVLLSDVKAEPSPTTGTYSVGLVMHDTFRYEKLSSPRVVSSTSACNDESARDFESKPQSRLSSVSGLPPLVQLDSADSNSMNVPVSSSDFFHIINPPNGKDGSGAAGSSRAVPDDSHLKEVQESHMTHANSIDFKKSSSLGDGYNWRKYGQKHVKGSEFPRSYYKCTHPNCEVKKLLEQSHDGQIAEILYKGRHDHPKPQPNRRLAVGAVLSSQKEERLDKSHSAIKDRFSNGLGAFHHNEPNATPELSPSADNGDSEGVGFNASKMADETNDEDDPELKRRKIDYGGIDMTSMGKVTREPRVVVQTVSEVDILDDGYRWRKYGQKVVKGNPNPRSYYKCTNAGCQVRKLVERASHDPKAVITTYEGKHNHDVPSFSRTSDHNTAGCATLNDSTSPSDAHIPSAGVPRYHHSEESDVISLDLGVGVSSNSRNKTNETELSLEKEQLRSHQIQMSAPNSEVIQTIPNSTYYGGKSDDPNPFGSSKKEKSWNFKPSSVNHSSNAYQQNIGELVMGP